MLMMGVRRRTHTLRRKSKKHCRSCSGQRAEPGEANQSVSDSAVLLSDLLTVEIIVVCALVEQGVFEFDWSFDLH